MIVLHVAEKPSICTAVARALAGNCDLEQRGRSPPVYEFEGEFRGAHCTVRVTSVVGHVFSTDFPSQYQSWETTDPAELFQAPVLSTAESKGIVKHLEREGSGVDYLVLWLDCDREGENICFEVIRCCEGVMKRGAHYHLGPEQTVFRAKFSAVTERDIRLAMLSLGAPNENESRAVECRQELDLKVGVAFTRFQTRFFQGRYGDLDSSVISYGPCQTPTLGFVVDRLDEINSFQPESFWSVSVAVDPGAGGSTLQLEWQRGRLFDQQAAEVFHRLVSEDKLLICTAVKERETRLTRPAPLNTVQLLKLASTRLGIGPHAAMRAAESLYLAGCLSYPRTESTAYPRSFDVREALREHTSHPDLGSYVSELMRAGHTPPRSGVDVGDHPPITPVGPLGGGHSVDAIRVFDLVFRHFLATVSPDARFLEKKLSFRGPCSEEEFSARGKEEIDPGFLAVYRRDRAETFGGESRDNGDDDCDSDGGERGNEVAAGVLPAIIVENGQYRVTAVKVVEGRTAPPGFLTEAELIGLMEKHKIGTDASIPTHINNLQTRNYVSLGRGRTMLPSPLGVVLVHGYRSIDPSLVQPDVRAAIERFCDLIAKGAADKRDVIAHSLRCFEAKFGYFCANIARMDQLFEASFSPLAQSGKMLSKCGKCLRYMRLIEAPPTRLHCPTCEETYALPQGGIIKLYKELKCPLDNFELVLFSLGNKDTAMGKTFPLCPFCYSSPPSFGGDAEVGGGVQSQEKMGCNSCQHPSCKHSGFINGMLECPGVGADNVACSGTLVLDVNSKPNWRLSCNIPGCNILLRFHADIHSISPLRSLCPQCGLHLTAFEFNKTRTPLKDGNTSLVGCIVCCDELNSISEITQGRTRNLQLLRQERQKRGGGGTGRGRGGRGGGGRREPRDPKMSFRDW